MENKIIIANMKMYMNLNDINSYIELVTDKITDNVIICPSSIYIPYFIDKFNHIGIQNVYYKEGAYTGEISPKVVHDFGVEYVIVGHSERREYFNETDLLINEKIKACVDNKLKVILCVGETLNEKNNLEKNEVLKKQISIALENISSDNYKNIIIAYEPRWAIGTNIIPTIKEIEDTISYIKSIVKDIRIVYGGSVNEENISKINKISNLDGFMIGASCVNPLKFIKIVNIVNKTNI